MAIARLTGGPLDGQLIPLEDATEEQLIMPYIEGQMIYQRVGEPDKTGDTDGATQIVFAFVATTEPADSPDE